MQTIEELLVAVRVDLKNNKAVLMSLADIEKKFFGTAEAAKKTDSTISNIGKNQGLKHQAANAAQLLSQVTHTNNGLHTMHALLSKIGGTGPVAGAVGFIMAAVGGYKMSEAVGKFEAFQRMIDFTFGDRADQVRTQATDTAREYGTNELDLIEGYRQMTKKGVGGSMQDVLLLQEAAKLEQRTLASAVEAIADAQVGEFKRLKEYGIKGSSPRGSDSYRLLNAATGEIEMVKRDDPTAIRQVVMAMLTEKYGGALEATKETIPAKMQNVKGALWEGNESVWAMIAQGATDPIYEAWQDMSEDLIAWIKDPEVQSALKNIGRGLGEGILLIARVVQLIGVAVDKLMPVFDFIGTSLGVFFDVAEAGFNTLGATLSGDWDKAVAAWTEWGEVIWLGLQLLALKAVNSFLDLIEAFVPGMEEARAMATDMFEWLAESWDNSKDWVTSAFDWMHEKWNEFTSWLGGLVDTVLEKLRAASDFFNVKMFDWAKPEAAPSGPQVNATYNINGYNPQAALAAARVNTAYLYG